MYYDDAGNVSAHQIRPVDNADSLDLIELIAGCFSAYPGCVFALHEMPELSAPATSFADKAGQAWVAEREGRIVGSVGIHPVGSGDWELTKLYVRATERRRGIGRMLVDCAVDTARQEGGTRVLLWTDTRFVEAHRLYRRMAFADTGRTRDVDDLSGTREFYFERYL